MVIKNKFANFKTTPVVFPSTKLRRLTIFSKLNSFEQYIETLHLCPVRTRASCESEVLQLTVF